MDHSVSQEREDKAGNLTKTLIILNLAVIAGLIYLLSLFFAYPVFQNSRLADPLAEINSLFPLYYIAIAIIALLLVGCLIWRVGGKWLHILLLIMFAVMLWLTPYLLTGFVRLGDSAWHTGVAMKIPQVLAGEPLPFSGYAWSFPGSYIYHYSFVSIVDIQPLTYIDLFPLFCLLLFVLLCYLLAAKLFGPRAALLSMLLAIPGLHYLQLHSSPHAIGALLMLTALLLLTQRGAAAKIMPIVVMVTIAIIASHPTTPLLLSIFIAAALLTDIVYSRRISRIQVALAGILVVCFAGWFSWFAFYHASSGGGASSIGNTAYLYQSMTPGDIEVSQEFMTGTPFIYANIYNLNRGIYFVYAAVAMLVILYIAARAHSEEKSVRKWLSKLAGLNRSETCVAFSIPPLIILTILLAESSHGLIETGLTYIILVLSCIIASAVTRSHWIRRKTAPFFLVLGALFLTLTSPIVAYSIDAYSSFPRSEEAGLEFLVADGSLGGKTVAGMDLRQLALYPQYSLPQTSFINLGSQKVSDIAVFRNTGYYYAAMRKDVSFEDNRHTKYLAMIESKRYDRIYSSPTFEVYSKNK